MELFIHIQKSNLDFQSNVMNNYYLLETYIALAVVQLQCQKISPLEEEYNAALNNYTIAIHLLSDSNILLFCIDKTHLLIKNINGLIKIAKKISEHKKSDAFNIECHKKIHTILTQYTTLDLPDLPKNLQYHAKLKAIKILSKLIKLSMLQNDEGHHEENMSNIFNYIQQLHKAFDRAIISKLPNQYNYLLKKTIELFCNTGIFFITNEKSEMAYRTLELASFILDKFLKKPNLKIETINEINSIKMQLIATPEAIRMKNQYSESIESLDAFLLSDFNSESAEFQNFIGNLHKMISDSLNESLNSYLSIIRNQHCLQLFTYFNKVIQVQKGSNHNHFFLKILELLDKLVLNLPFKQNPLHFELIDICFRAVKFLQAHPMLVQRFCNHITQIADSILVNNIPKKFINSETADFLINIVLKKLEAMQINMELLITELKSKTISEAMDKHEELIHLIRETLITVKHPLIKSYTLFNPKYKNIFKEIFADLKSKAANYGLEEKSIELTVLPKPSISPSGFGLFDLSHVATDQALKEVKKDAVMPSLSFI